MCYKKVDRYLRYELSQGVNFSEFDVSKAPLSLSLVNNGDERLLICKVFKGRDAAGRQSVYFSYLISVCFQSLRRVTLFACGTVLLFVSFTQQDKASSDTQLERISYNTLCEYV